MKAKEQHKEFCFQMSIQILIGAANKNGADQKPTPIWNAHVWVNVNVICKPSMENTQANWISENEKCIRTWRTDRNRLRIDISSICQRNIRKKTVVQPMVCHLLLKKGHQHDNGKKILFTFFSFSLFFFRPFFAHIEQSIEHKKNTTNKLAL